MDRDVPCLCRIFLPRLSPWLRVLMPPLLNRSWCLATGVRRAIEASWFADFSKPARIIRRPLRIYEGQGVEDEIMDEEKRFEKSPG
jgi:hypothetical protein